MPNRLFAKAPPALSALATFLLLALVFGREASVEEDLPAFLQVDRGPAVYIGLSGTVKDQGVYQFYDDVTLDGVTKLTDQGGAVLQLKGMDLQRVLVSGEMLIVDVTADNRADFKSRWLPSPHRMALGIALHPDRMTRKDWEILPGIGEVLAARIEMDRQKNGEFGHIEALTRVHGIGDKRVASWRPFFLPL